MAYVNVSKKSPYQELNRKIEGVFFSNTYSGTHEYATLYPQKLYNLPMQVLGRKTTLWVMIGVVVAIFIRLGDYQARIANVLFDDHVQTYVQYYLNPALYEGDSFLSIAKTFMFLTLPNWLGLFFSKLGVSPAVYSLLMLLLQNILILLGLLRMGGLLSQHREVVVLTALLTLGTEAWSNNLAYYPNLPLYLYPGQLVLAPLLASSISLLEKKWRQALIWQAVAALIHPSLTLHCVAFTGIFLYLENKKDFSKASRKFLPFLGIVFLCIIPPLMALGKLPNRLNSHEMFEAMKLKGHFFPWTTGYFWPLCVPGFLTCVFLALLASSRLKNRINTLGRWVRAVVVTTIILGIIHLGAVYLEIPRILQLCPLRMTELLLFFLFPVGILYLIESIRSPDRGLRATAAVLLVLCVLSPTGFYWVPLLILYFQPRLPKNSTHWLLFFWIGAFFALGRPARELLGENLATSLRHWFFPGSVLSGSLFLASLCAGCVAWWGKSLLVNPRKKVGAIPSIAIGTFLLLTILKTWFDAGLEGRKGFSQDLLRAQRWASTETREDASFLVSGTSFRVFSNRKVIDATPTDMHVYTGDRETKEKGDLIKHFISEHGVSEFEKLTTREILDFSHSFGGNYIVWKESRPLMLEEAFRSGNLVIYAIPDLQRLGPKAKGLRPQTSTK